MRGARRTEAERRQGGSGGGVVYVCCQRHRVAGDAGSTPTHIDRGLRGVLNKEHDTTAVAVLHCACCCKDAE